MTNKKYHFDGVSLLVTHYNRSFSLERLLTTFANLHCFFDDIIVSDDGSREEHLQKLKLLQEQFAFKLITTLSNKGLGNNINKGQDAVTTEFTLYVQEDFEPSPIFAEHFLDALDIMKNHHEIDLIRFYAYFKYPYTKAFGKGFSEMVFHIALWYPNHLKFYCYSDHPHLRRSNFLEKFGRYPEGLKGDKTEYRMALSFIKKYGKGLLFDDFTKLFYQKNSSEEPSTMGRSSWRESRNPFILFVRFFYLQIKLLKWTLDLIFMK